MVVLPAHSNAHKKAKLVSRLQSNKDELLSRIDELEAAGPTPLQAGIRLARESMPDRQVAMERICVMFTDGMPAQMQETTRQAELLTNSARLITVGIGEDVLAPFLRSISSSPKDYFYAECPEDILGAFSSVAQVLWSGANGGVIA